MLVIGLGNDAEAELISFYPKARKLNWPFTKPRNLKPDTPFLLFPPHPGSLRWKRIDSPERTGYAPSLAEAIDWCFSVR